jgi:hypothetical protein
LESYVYETRSKVQIQNLNEMQSWMVSVVF